jgi:hypothetical protein
LSVFAALSVFRRTSFPFCSEVQAEKSFDPSSLCNLVFSVSLWLFS